MTVLRNAAETESHRSNHALAKQRNKNIPASTELCAENPGVKRQFLKDV